MRRKPGDCKRQGGDVLQGAPTEGHRRESPLSLMGSVLCTASFESVLPLFRALQAAVARLPAYLPACSGTQL